ncbi:MAG TPA: hypothetical protein VM734_30145 [Kofleriaceae bacterium]|jgi:hypothetical protein|nr:hypothetical protein [Kofleriaceae bacterium]
MVGWWALQLGIIGALLVATEVAFRLGAARQANVDEHVRGQTTTVQAAMLGLVGLLLGFSMSMAEERFTVRRSLIVDEANAIGTAYLRTQLLAEPDGARSRALFRDYVAVRREFVAAGRDLARIEAASARSQQLQGQIWAIGVASARVHPDWDVMTAYLEALNTSFDLEAARYASVFARIPATIFVLLVVVAVIAVAATGYACGFDGRRNVLASYVFPTLLGLACALVIDLAHPRSGLIRTGDAPMARLQRSLGTH